MRWWSATCLRIRSRSACRRPCDPGQCHDRDPVRQGTNHDLGVVAIGRNEGARLRACLASVIAGAGCTVYVDSGSTDGSAELARSMGAVVVDLDMRQPFTAARARNVGFEMLLSTLPGVQFVQFVDGDCEVRPDWFVQARSFLDANPQVAAVCGRRRERFPERSVYNLLCDLEWNTPIGDTRACGGDVLMRAAALRQVGGYRADLIAGEEPELCIRLRGAGWRVWRADLEMTLHDAGMTRIGQWWKRTTRTGFAFAEGAHLHGASPERHWVRESRSAWLWGLGLPITIIGAATLFSPWWWLVAALYPLQVLRLFLRGSGPVKARAWRAVFLVLSKFAEAYGQATFVARRWSGGPAKLIEYK
ncbi:MAG: glycosyltransferase [Rhizobacter sp.]|nr:glycosyltransferase [Rhizobacter sp.]